MDEKEKDEIEFDPESSEDFYKNLERAIREDQKEQNWEPSVEEEDAPWIAISEQEDEIKASALQSEEVQQKEVQQEEVQQEEVQQEEVQPEIEDNREWDETTKEPELPTLDFSDDLFQMEEEEALFQEKEPADEMLLGINAALAEQIELEFGKNAFAEPKQPNRFLKLWREIPKWCKIVSAVLLSFILCAFLLFGTTGGQKVLARIAVEILFSKIQVDDGTDDPNIVPSRIPGNNMGGGETNPGAEITGTVTPPAVTENPNVTPVPTLPIPTGGIVEDDSVINVLLVGVENHKNLAKYGRSDSMMIASIDKDGGPLKLVSLMRDMYVKIPGENDDKLNAAYAHGGISLLVDTIELNFGVKLDGYVIVQYEGFENIIDQLGGLRLSLTAEESEYLNTTNYISKTEERNTKPGYQTMTGSQVLGFCRVRKVPTANGKYGDFGRTYRQRMVLDAIFEKYKEKNITELYSVMNNCFKYVKVSAGLKEVAYECLTTVIERKMFTLDQMQMPPAKHYDSARIQNMDVIVFYPDAIDLLHEFIYKSDN